jgi:hypothetical protein
MQTTSSNREAVYNNNGVLDGIPNLVWNNNILSLTAWGETLTTSDSSATFNIDCILGNNFVINMVGNITTVTFSNIPAAGVIYGLHLWIVQTSIVPYTISWPSAVRWGLAGVPSLSVLINNVDIISLVTLNGGTTWYGFLAGKNF